MSHRYSVLLGWFCLAIFMLGSLSACGGKSTNIPTSTPTLIAPATPTHQFPTATTTSVATATIPPMETATQTSGPNTTRTRRPTFTPRPTQTLHSTPTKPASDASIPTETATPRPEIIWSDTFGTPISLDWVDIEWSPTANELLLHARGMDLTPLFKAVAPDFKPITLTLPTLWHNSNFIWTPDGHSIVYNSPKSDNGSDYLWLMNEDGSNAHLINNELPVTNFMLLGGWMDAQNLVFDNYSGGGHFNIGILDITTGEAYEPTFVHGATCPPNAHYVPATSDTGNYDPKLLVISKQITTYNELPRAMGYFKPIPDYNNTSAITQFEGWWGNSNQILVTWESYTGYVENLPAAICCYEMWIPIH